MRLAILIQIGFFGFNLFALTHEEVCQQIVSGPFGQRLAFEASARGQVVALEHLAPEVARVQILAVEGAVERGVREDSRGGWDELVSLIEYYQNHNQKSKVDEWVTFFADHLPPTFINDRQRPAVLRLLPLLDHASAPFQKLERRLHDNVDTVFASKALYVLYAAEDHGQLRQPRDGVAAYIVQWVKDHAHATDFVALGKDLHARGYIRKASDFFEHAERYLQMDPYAMSEYPGFAPWFDEDLIPLLARTPNVSHAHLFERLFADARLIDTWQKLGRKPDQSHVDFAIEELARAKYDPNYDPSLLAQYQTVKFLSRAIAAKLAPNQTLEEIIALEPSLAKSMLCREFADAAENLNVDQVYRLAESWQKSNFAAAKYILEGKGGHEPTPNGVNVYDWSRTDFEDQWLPVNGDPKATHFYATMQLEIAKFWALNRQPDRGEEVIDALEGATHRITNYFTAWRTDEPYRSSGFYFDGGYARGAFEREFYPGEFRTNAYLTLAELVPMARARLTQKALDSDHANDSDAVVLRHDRLNRLNRIATMLRLGQALQKVNRWPLSQSYLNKVETILEGIETLPVPEHSRDAVKAADALDLWRYNHWVARVRELAIFGDRAALEELGREVWRIDPEKAFDAYPPEDNKLNLAINLVRGGGQILEAEAGQLMITFAVEKMAANNPALARTILLELEPQKIFADFKDQKLTQVMEYLAPLGEGPMALTSYVQQWLPIWRRLLPNRDLPKARAKAQAALAKIRDRVPDATPAAGWEMLFAKLTSRFQ